MIAYSYYIGGIYIIECTGWYVDNEGIAEFKIANDPNPFTKLYADRLDISKEDETTAFDPIRGSVKEQL